MQRLLMQTNDEELNAMKAEGAIKIETCCGNGVRCDHNLQITMQDGTQIESYSDSVRTELNININNVTYRQEGESNFLLGIMSLFAGISPQTVPPKKYTKCGPDGSIPISAEDFDAVLKQLPPTIKNVLQARLSKAAGMQMVMINTEEKDTELTTPNTINQLGL